MSNEIEHEQKYVAMLYRRVDDLREQSAKRLAGALREVGGTRQARLEREASFSRYAERVAKFDAAERGLCFGRLDLRDGARHYIGRIGILDEEGDPLLLDWRAPAARPFYVATAAAPEGVRRRRHITTRNRTVTTLDDELLEGDTAADEGLIGEAALLAAVNTGRTGRMRDIVETLQAEQDEIIRSGHRGVLVVQGGPGTGKTAVALHRAAYLLYTHRHLAERGVLVVGPNTTFLRYIGQVLPGLGETSVLLSTVAGLFPGVVARRAEPPAVAEIKGRAMMADVVAAAVRNRQAPPRGPLTIPYGRESLTLEEKDYRRAAETARNAPVLHNQARRIFVREILDVLTGQVAERLEAVVRDENGEPLDGGDGRGMLAEADVRALVAAGYPEEFLDDDAEERPLLDEGDYADLRRELAANRDVRAALDELWPTLTPQRLLTDLFADPKRLRDAAPNLTDTELNLLQRTPDTEHAPLQHTPGHRTASDTERELLQRTPGHQTTPDTEHDSLQRTPGDPTACEVLQRAHDGWSASDVPLLDEAAELLGDDDREVAAQAAGRRRAEAERREQIAYAEGVLEISVGSRSTDLEEGEESEILTAADLLGAGALAERQETVTHRTIAERAAADRTWAFGHVIVDEAQELSEMAWRLLMRRCPTRSMTIVGDVAQTGDAAGTSSWERVLQPHVRDRWRLTQLTVNYRTPAEIMAAAADLLAALDPALAPPRSVRETGVPPWRVATTPADLPRVLAEHAVREMASLGEGRLAVIVPDARIAELAAAIPNAAHGNDQENHTAEVAAAIPDAAYDPDQESHTAELAAAITHAAHGNEPDLESHIAEFAAAITDAAHGADPDLESRVVVLGVRQAKGLEFDSVLIADPAAILAASPRGRNDLYVALTRATQRLGIVHPGPPPAELGGISAASSFSPSSSV